MEQQSLDLIEAKPALKKGVYTVQPNYLLVAVDQKLVKDVDWGIC